MGRRILYLPLFLSLLMIYNLFAQDMPLVYDFETNADYPKPYLPTFDELPVIESLPDPFEWSDGSDRIKNKSDWDYRRNEIGTEILNYELGTKPLPPENLEASYSSNTLRVTITVDGNSLTLTAPIVLPEGDGPFPAVIGVGLGTGSLPSDIFTDRGVATVQFNYQELAPRLPSRGEGGFYTLYPDSKVGSFAAWAWGVSRIIDGLEQLSEINIDLNHLAITGCSFAGKIALFSGAFDERIALTISQEPGGGGDAAWRVSESLDASVETLGNAQGSAWYYEDVSQFNNNVDKLPYDHHELMAMIAPRALLVLGNPDYEWLADESGYVGCMAAKEVWKALGVAERFGFSKAGDHTHCSLPDGQRPEVIAFVEKFLLSNDETDTDVAIHPGYTTDLSQWITWDTPELGNDTTRFTTLAYPVDAETGLDTSITFKWHKVDDAEQYYVQLSTDLDFDSLFFSDSLSADTSITVNGLAKKNMYYWRVRVKNYAGLGLWSTVSSFITTLSSPDVPLQVSVTSGETGYATFTWNSVDNTEQYKVQTSIYALFTRVLTSATTGDTIETMSAFSEGEEYYWRVRSENFVGASSWSTIKPFMILNTPSGLAAQINDSDMVILTWDDNSQYEEGYIIECKQEGEDSFQIIDTLSTDVSEYADLDAEENETYFYRVKAYSDSIVSGYSNEASLTVTGIEEESLIPTEYSLSQNYPNPFNPATKIKFALPQAGLTRLIVYDLLGREVKRLVDKEMQAGYHEINFNAGNLSNGVYFYKLKSGDYISTKKMVLLK